MIITITNEDNTINIEKENEFTFIIFLNKKQNEKKEYTCQQFENEV